MSARILGLLIGFVLLTLLFWTIELRWPGIPAQKRLRRGFRTDVFYWFFTPLVTRGLSRIVPLVALVPLLLLTGRSLEKEALAAGWGPVADLPVAAQVAVVLVAGDLVGYWTHRWFHSPALWKFHAIHHSSQDLDWLSSVRLHPVNDVLSRTLRAVPFVLLGFSPTVIAGYIPFLTFHGILLHANVDWTFGPLRKVVSSPVFHRWHHSAEPEAEGKNLAGLLPLWDIVFGTYYMPEGKLPRELGAPEAAVPDGFWGQMAYPFRRG
ncbi:MAG: sterol desaturase family protein [Acidobacteria bacterium]|nr:sterol desaturase family protein [Acidobacteriota bacterium]